MVVPSHSFLVFPYITEYFRRDVQYVLRLNDNLHLRLTFK